MIIIKGFASVNTTYKGLIIQTPISNTIEEAKKEDSKHSWLSDDIKIKEVEIHIIN